MIFVRLLVLPAEKKRHKSRLPARIAAPPFLPFDWPSRSLSHRAGVRRSRARPCRRDASSLFAQEPFALHRGTVACVSFATDRLGRALGRKQRRPTCRRGTEGKSSSSPRSSRFGKTATACPWTDLASALHGAVVLMCSAPPSPAIMRDEIDAPRSRSCIAGTQWPR